MTLSAQQDFCFLKVCDRRVVFSDVVIGISAIKKESKLAGFVWVGFGIPLDRFFIVVRMVKGRIGDRLYQVQKGGNRHVMDIRQADVLLESLEIEGIWVMALIDLMTSQVVAFDRRRGKPKAGTDWWDLGDVVVAVSGVEGGVWGGLGAVGCDGYG